MILKTEMFKYDPHFGVVKSLGCCKREALFHRSYSKPLQKGIWRKTKMKKFLSIMALFVISLLTVSMVSAVSEDSSLGDLLTSGLFSVEVNDEEYDSSALLTVKEGEELEVEVKLENHGDPMNPLHEAKNIEVEARLMGYDEEDVKASKIISSLKQGTEKKVTFTLLVPEDFKNGEATLTVFVYGGNDVLIAAEYTLHVESPSHGMTVADVSFSPGKTVRAGQSLLTTVLLENNGENTEEDVKVTVEMPALGLSASEFVNKVEADNKEDVPEMFLSLPATTAPGEYEVKVTVAYDDLKKSVSHTETVTVIANDYLNSQMFPATGKLALAVGPERQAVTAGKTASYGLALTNEGGASKALVLEAATGGWASATLSETLVVLEPGKSQVVYLDLAVASDAAAGEHLASVTVKSGNDVLETVVLKADVAAAPAAPAESTNNSVSLRNGLEIAGIVLVVLVVVMGLVLGFSKLRKDDDGEEHTYY